MYHVFLIAYKPSISALSQGFIREQAAEHVATHTTVHVTRNILEHSCGTFRLYTPDTSQMSPEKVVAQSHFPTLLMSTTMSIRLHSTCAAKCRNTALCCVQSLRIVHNIAHIMLGGQLSPSDYLA